MPAFTPAITLLNCLELVRLKRSISIFLVISNLLRAAAPCPSCIIASVLLCSGPSRLRFSALRTTRPWLKARRSSRPKRPERPEVTAVADVEIRSSDRWQGEPRRRCNAPHYAERRHDSDPDSCRLSRSVSWQVPL